MNRALPPGDLGDRSGAESGQSGYSGSMLSALGLVGGSVAHPKRKTPPGVNPAARCERKGSVSGFDGVAALSVLALGGRNGQAHFLPYGSRKEPRRECGCQLVALSSSLAVAPPGRFSRSRMVAVLLPSRAPFRALLGAFFFGLAFFPALPLAGATCASGGLFSGLCFGRCLYLFDSRYHRISLRGNYRDHMNCSGRAERQANCVNCRRRWIGDAAPTMSPGVS